VGAEVGEEERAAEVGEPEAEVGEGTADEETTEEDLVEVDADTAGWPVTAVGGTAGEVRDEDWGEEEETDANETEGLTTEEVTVTVTGEGRGVEAGKAEEENVEEDKGGELETVDEEKRLLDGKEDTDAAGVLVGTVPRTG
jgi:hypothetical protein